MKRPMGSATGRPDDLGGRNALHAKEAPMKLKINVKTLKATAFAAASIGALVLSTGAGFKFL